MSKIFGKCERCDNEVSIENDASSIFCKRCGTRIYIAEIKKQNELPKEEKDSTLVDVMWFAAIVESFPGIITLPIFFFWKLKNRSSTWIRLIVFLSVAVGTLIYSTVGLINRGVNFPEIAVWISFVIGLFCLVRVAFDIYALRRDNFPKRSSSK
ncbi:MAG: hypothetical protein FWC00_04315 [Firmicutes bacterium]|nr:hypothetical protein [Bacillota bacterium]